MLILLLVMHMAVIGVDGWHASNNLCDVAGIVCVVSGMCVGSWVDAYSWVIGQQLVSVWHLDYNRALMGVS